MIGVDLKQIAVYAGREAMPRGGGRVLVRFCDPNDAHNGQERMSGAFLLQVSICHMHEILKR